VCKKTDTCRWRLPSECLSEVRGHLTVAISMKHNRRLVGHMCEMAEANIK
jgi:hypothetical protein